ncbi:hypothetical protein [Streptomyces olindensis]|uniref:hypothetical protein n=1 Tax=Streptomyces olindensis TaxID=358823 RepID=UPI003F4D14A4
MSELTSIPAPAGATFDGVVKRTAGAEHIPDDRLPAVSAVRVAGLVRPAFLMEVEAFAVVAP